MKAVKIQNLKKYFGKTKAVDDISLEVTQGEVFGFLGPNGAGKSTTIRCMMSFLSPTSGKISLLGHDPQKDPVSIKKSAGYLAAEPENYSKWSAEDHFSFAESVRGKSNYKDELVERLKLKMGTPAKNLSFGNKQKLNLVLALMHKPKLLIMDEPTNGLDPLLQNEIYKILRELSKDGTTIFTSSHNLHEVERICEKVAIIKNGKLVTTESIEKLQKKRLYDVRAFFKSHKDALACEEEFDGKQKVSDNILSFTTKEDVNHIMNILNKYKLSDLEIEKGSLEDIFLEYYED